MGGTIEVNNLEKHFVVTEREPGLKSALATVFKRHKKQIAAVNKINFTVPAGTIVGFIGQNGAGKTTTIKMLTGTLYPSSGSINVAGFNPSERTQAFRRDISVVMGNKAQIMLDLTPNDYLQLIQVMYDVDPITFEQNVNEMTELLHVDHRLNVQARKLSLGERMKVEFVAAVATNPQVLFLDEPTIGLDVQSKREIRQFIRRLNQDKQTTIFLTSHDMEDISAVCDQMILLNHGEVIWDGQLSQLIQEFDEYRYLSFEKGMVYQADQLGFPIMEETFDRVTIKVPTTEVNAMTNRLTVNRLGTAVTVQDLQLDDIILEVFNTEVQG